MKNKSTIFLWVKIGLHKFSNLDVLHKCTLMQDWVFRPGLTLRFNDPTQKGKPTTNWTLLQLQTYLERLFVGASCEKPLPFTLGWLASSLPPLPPAKPRPRRSAEPLLLLLLLLLDADVSKLTIEALGLAGSPSSLLLLREKEKL